MSKPDDDPSYFAIWSVSGAHVGVWSDRATAGRVFLEYPGGRMEALYDARAIATDRAEGRAEGMEEQRAAQQRFEAETLAVHESMIDAIRKGEP